MAVNGDLGTRIRRSGWMRQATDALAPFAQRLRRLRERLRLPQIAATIKDRMPKGLYVRSILIVVMPILILQAVVAYVFMERHWQTVTRRLSTALTRDIAAMIEVIETYPQDRALLRDHAHRRRHAWPHHLRPAARSAAGGRAAAVLLAARPRTVARAAAADQPALLDRHGRRFRHRRDPHRPRRPRAARLRAAQPGLRLELAHLPAVDGRHLAGADRHRASLPAQPDQPDPDARRGRRAVRQGPPGRLVPAARRARGAPGGAGLHRHARADRAAGRAAHDHAVRASATICAPCSPASSWSSPSSATRPRPRRCAATSTR